MATLQTSDAIRELVVQSPPAPNPSRINAIRELLGQITIDDSYFFEKRDKLKRSVDQYFGPRRWQSHRAGAQGVRDDIDRLLRAIERHAIAVNAAKSSP